MNSVLILRVIDRELALYERRANNPRYHKFARDTNRSCYNSIQQIKKMIIDSEKQQDNRRTAGFNQGND